MGHPEHNMFDNVYGNFQYYPPGHVESTTSTNTSSFDPLKDFKKTWEVIKEPTFMLMFVEYILFLGGAPFICILSSSVVLQSFPEKTDKSLSMMLCVAYGAGWVTVIIAGRVLDRIKRKHNVLIVSIIASDFGDALCSYGLYFHNYYYVFAGYVINSSFRDVMYLCVVHANVCKMARDEPVARIRVFLLLTLTRAVTPLHALFVRFILNYAGAPVSVLYPVLLEISLGILHVNRQE
uniref:uncharacterized protein LOC120345433 n=1 Tax=Styela clava TaxID=7725 RepID=UPI00193ABB2B|nr:uncharacterized protein LOC120345433 [Styela clava]